jgi:hypothetical protein
MVQTSHLEEFLKIVIGLPRLVLEVTLCDCNIPLVRTVCFLVVVVIANSDCDPPGVSLSPHFAVLGAFLSAFAGGFRWCHLAAVGGHFPIA